MDDPTTQLFECASTRNVRGLMASLAAGADVNSVDGRLCTALHRAVEYGGTQHHAACVSALLEAGADPCAPSATWRTVVHRAHAPPLGRRHGQEGVRGSSAGGRSGSAAQGFRGWLPAHEAARFGCTHVLLQLLAAAPGAALVASDCSRLPLESALLCRQAEAARCLLTEGRLQPAGEVLDLLERCNVRRSVLLKPLYASVAARQPLTAAEWALLPSPCPGLAAALPTVLQRSAEEAALLVQRLPAADRARLRTAALCLTRVQCAWGTPLPTPIVWLLLALSLDSS